VKLRQSSVYYVEELNLKAKEKNQFILILFLCSLGVIILTVTILFPVISKVNMARMKVLSLFVDIPNHHVITLATKCEDFISSFQEEEQNDEMESEEGE
jgi:ABC-type lipoprotein release transport system permease subunit